MVAQENVQQICVLYVSALLHLSLLWVQYLVFFSLLWSVCLRWQREHAVHTHLQQVKTLILSQRRIQRPEALIVKGKTLANDRISMEECRDTVQITFY